MAISVSSLPVRETDDCVSRLIRPFSRNPFTELTIGVHLVAGSGIIVRGRKDLQHSCVHPTIYVCVQYITLVHAHPPFLAWREQYAYMQARVV